MRVWIWGERSEVNRLFLEKLVGISLLVAASRDGIDLGVLVGIHCGGCMINARSQPRRVEIQRQNIPEGRTPQS